MQLLYRKETKYHSSTATPRPFPRLICLICLSLLLGRPLFYRIAKNTPTRISPSGGKIWHWASLGLAVSLAVSLSAHVVTNSQEYPDLLNVSPMGGEGLSVSLAMGLALSLAMRLMWALALALALVLALTLALLLALRSPDGATLVWVLWQFPLS